jgi:redox-sensitive bicupin YhaK (pirin superfamily)
MTNRTIHTIADAIRRPGPPGLHVQAVTADLTAGGMDPFLNIDVFEMDRPIFPPHPHAGFSALTYVLPESPTGVRNRDSLGHDLTISQGSLHWTTAGSGVMHEEVPLERGKTTLGLQIFVNLAIAKKRIAPGFLHLHAEDVPVVKSHGASARIVLGVSGGEASPLVPPTPVRLVDVTLEPGAAYTQSLTATENAFLFVMSGAVAFGAQTAFAGQVVRSETDGDALTLTAGPEGARAILFAGEPLREPAVSQGPFVAESREHLQRMMDDFRMGRMGRLQSIA